MTDLKELKKQSHHLKPFTSIGKQGITTALIVQLQRHLKANSFSKLKVLQSYLDETEKDIKDVAWELSKQTKSTVVDVRGKTISLYKR
ncbi:MAG: YhbY family RNA-binding protein [Nanobdellota archaeon]